MRRLKAGGTPGFWKQLWTPRLQRWKLDPKNYRSDTIETSRVFFWKEKFCLARSSVRCMPPTPINPFIALLMHISVHPTKTAQAGLQIQKFNQLLAGLLPPQSHWEFFFFSKYKTSARKPQKNSFSFKLSIVAMLPFMQLKEEWVFCGLMSLVKCEHKK